ncbi:hypothetical protein [Kitasatospora sp. NBC_01300]|uniref:hypothetical protein n=1 Tax=Kitasatospora sp. NBC_01300 TaxID=2903574 RepID=UPI00352DBC1D|nr:hypothetical protein OG556_16370 [Kitasatospora sp. NBC_01300]
MTYTRRGRLRVAAPDFNLGATWLASANREPEAAIDRWRAGQLADIETGELFNVLRVNGEQLGMAVLKGLRLADRPVGPVLHNRTGQCVEFLVTIRAAVQWSMSSTELIGRPADGDPPDTVAMPAPGMQRFSGRSWLVLPDGERRPTDLGDLAVALRHARDLLRRTDQ